MRQEYQITVENITTYTAPGGLPTFDISRTGGSALGNPEYVSKDCSEEERTAGIVAYKRWLWGHLREGKGRQFNELGILARAAQRGPIVLLCYCKPLSCHGDAVVTAIKWYQQKYLLVAYEGLPEMPAEEEVEDPETVPSIRARTLADMITPKQLWLIRKLCNEKRISIVDEFEMPMDCPLEEMNKRAGSKIIELLRQRNAE